MRLDTHKEDNLTTEQRREGAGLKDWSDVATDQGIPLATRTWKKKRNSFSNEVSRGRMACVHWFQPSDADCDF